MQGLRKFLLLAALVAAAPATAAGEPSLAEPLVLVARPELHDPYYGSTVIAVSPVPAGRHVGFIVNRPTATTLGELFPRHAPSREVRDPVFLGGPVDVGAIFALVAQPESPGGRSLAIGPGQYVAFDAPTVDAIIESSPEKARFVTGFVAWRPGELAHEIEIGAWFVREPDPALLLRSPAGLWEELVRRELHDASLLVTRAAPY